MEVILLESVNKLGTIGDVVKVKNGYARNYLIPQEKALRATKYNKEIFQARREELEAANKQARQEAEALAKKLEGTKLTLIRQAAEDGKLYGSVSMRDIAAALEEQDAPVDRKQLQMDTVIKYVGVYNVEARLHPEVSVSLQVTVARSEGEAESALRTELEEETKPEEEKTTAPAEESNTETEAEAKPASEAEEKTAS